MVWMYSSGWLLRTPKALMFVSGSGRMNHKCGGFSFPLRPLTKRQPDLFLFASCSFYLAVCIWAQFWSKRPWVQDHRACVFENVHIYLWWALCQEWRKGSPAACENVQCTTARKERIISVSVCWSEFNKTGWWALPLYLCVESFNREIWKLHHFPQTWKSN